MCNSSGIGGESIRDRSTATCNCQRPRLSVTQTSKHAITVPRAKTGTDARFLVCILLDVVVDIYFKTLKRTHLLPPPPVTNQFRFSKNIGNYGRPLRELLATMPALSAGRKFNSCLYSQYVVSIRTPMAYTSPRPKSFLRTLKLVSCVVGAYISCLLGIRSYLTGAGSLGRSLSGLRRSPVKNAKILFRQLLQSPPACNTKVKHIRKNSQM